MTFKHFTLGLSLSIAALVFHFNSYADAANLKKISCWSAEGSRAGDLSLAILKSSESGAVMVTDMEVNPKAPSLFLERFECDYEEAKNWIWCSAWVTSENSQGEFGFRLLIEPSKRTQGRWTGFYVEFDSKGSLNFKSHLTCHGVS